MADDFSDLEREFPQVVSGLRAGPLPDTSSERPSEQLWHAISAAVAGEQSGASPTKNGFETRRAAQMSQPPPTSSVFEDNAIQSDAIQSDAIQSNGADSKRPEFVGSTSDDFDATVAELGSRRLGRFMAIGFAAAAAVILVGVPLFLGIRGVGPEIDGGVELAVLGSSLADGEAALDGRTLSLGINDLEAVPASSTYELWLLQVDAEGNPVGIEWVGTIDDAESVEQTFEVPPEIDTNLYTVVDVSIEPDDGDLSHSGNSILRGNLNQS